MNEPNEETKPTVYPEQENPPRPTYSANIRGVGIDGWLYYGTSAVTIIITSNGERMHAQEFMFDDGQSGEARAKAKNVWRSIVLAVLTKV